MTNRNTTTTKSRRVRVLNTSCNAMFNSPEVFRKVDKLVSGNSPFINGKLRLRNNSLSRQLLVQEDNQTLVYVDRANCPYTCYVPSLYPSGGSFAGFFSPSRSLIYDQAVSRWYSQLSTMKVNAAEFFATRKQTVDLIATTAYRVGALYSSLRKGRNPFKGNASVNPKNASKLWLEHAYGWTPLLSDVKTVLDDELSKPPIFHHKVMTQRSLPTLTHVLKDTIPVYGVHRTSTWTVNGDYRVTIQADVTVKDPSIAFLQSMGLQNPETLAWELLPYSFVVDWFLPIGPWLESQRALMGLSVSNPAVTTTMRYYAICENRIVASAPSPIWGTGSARLGERTKSRSLTLPSLPLPKLKNPVSINHALNAIALLGVRFGR